MIAKVATAQDDITGDGTTSNVLIIGELLKQADLYISEVCMQHFFRRWASEKASPETVQLWFCVVCLMLKDMKIKYLFLLKMSMPQNLQNGRKLNRT